MSQRELSRLEVIQRVCRKALTQRRAPEQLALSVRQVKRLCRAYRREGAHPSTSTKPRVGLDASLAAHDGKSRWVVKSGRHV